MFFPPPVWPCFDISYISYIFMRCFDLFLSHMIMVLFRGPMLSYESKTWILWLPFVTCERFYWKIVTLILIIHKCCCQQQQFKIWKKKARARCAMFFYFKILLMEAAIQNFYCLINSLIHLFINLCHSYCHRTSWIFIMG